jgi:hypothetical protein
MPLVSVSNAQQLPLRTANFVATVYHGLRIGLHQPTFDPRRDDLAFLGRLSPRSGPIAPSQSPAQSACRSRSPPKQTR